MKGSLPILLLKTLCAKVINDTELCYFLNSTFHKSEHRLMIEALFYGENPLAYGSSLINDTFII